MTALVLAAHLLVTGAMAGLIWFVQIVHYPLLARVGTGAFAAYETAHMRLTTWVVAPLMLLELALSAFLALRPPPLLPAWMAWLGLALVAVIWTSTAVLQAPCHQRLARGFDRDLWCLLVRSNWIRTAAWSARAGLAVAMLATAVPAP